MASKADEVAALGGSRPSETGGADGGPSGGGLAVPTDQALMGGSDTLGDTASMDDGAGLPGAVSTRDSLAAEADAQAGPQVSPAGAEESSDDADAPTGGLSATGTIGGLPTGSADTGLGDKGG